MKRKILLLVLCLIFLAMAGYFGHEFLSNWKEYKDGEKAYDSLSQYAHVAEQAAKPEKPKTEVPEPAPEAADELAGFSVTAEEDPTVWPEVDFEALQAINPDVIGWIYMEDSQINYPIVQGIDNDQYIKKLADGRYNIAGSIFMDYRNQPDLGDRHTVIYGHRMNNGSMFGALVNYKDQAYYDSHPQCLLLTPEANYKLEFFSGYVAELDEQAWKLEFESDEEFAEWLDEAIEKSTFKSEVSPTAQDRIVTLSTCTRDNAYTRYVLLGVLR